MRKIAIGLTSLLLMAAVSKPAAAQEATIVFPQHPCIWYEAVEFPGCVNYGSLGEEQARTARGHPQFIEPQGTETQAGSECNDRSTCAGSSRPRSNRTTAKQFVL